jgi:hypothetical protein
LFLLTETAIIRPMNEQLKRNITRGVTWRRGLYMVLFAICYSIAEIILAAVVIFQFISTIITGRVNERLLVFGRSLSVYAWEVWMFLTYNREEKPYPFGTWPGDETADHPEKMDLRSPNDSASP